MNKTELKYKVRKNLGTDGIITIKSLELIVDEVFELMAEALENGEEVNIYNFGKFSTSTTKEHIGRNPQDITEFIKIPEHTKVNFSTGRELRRRLDKSRLDKKRNNQNWKL